MGKLKHGHSRRDKDTSKTYIVWKHMRQRCDNPKDKSYSLYGGRGISYCSRWEKYENFLSDMGERPSNLELDRIDSNGNYEPSNCRWADRATQVNNRRNCRKYWYKGEYLNLKEWANKIGISYQTLVTRINSGWDFEKAVETPIQTSLSEKEKELIKELDDKGYKKCDISKKVGVSYDKVRYYLKKYVQVWFP